MGACFQLSPAVALQCETVVIHTIWTLTVPLLATYFTSLNICFPLVKGGIIPLSYIFVRSRLIHTHVPNNNMP
jgi:hypothetical protein